MIKYEDNLAARVNGNNLQPLAGAEVRVTDKATGLPAALYQDDELTPIPQPLITTNTGYFGFKAANGEYLLSFSPGTNSSRFDGFTRDCELYDADDVPSPVSVVLSSLGAEDGAGRVGYGSRTVADKLGELVSLADKGGIPGAPDNTAQFAAALAAAAGGELHISAGEFTILPTALPNDITISGAGMRLTRIKMRAGSTGDLLHNLAAKNVTLRDLTLDGNNTFCASGRCLKIVTAADSDGPALILDNVAFENGPISAEDGQSSVFISGLAWVQAKNVRSIGHKASLWLSTVDSTFDNLYTGNTGIAAGLPSLVIGGSSNKFKTCYFGGNGAGRSTDAPQVRLLGAKSNEFSNCTNDSANGHGYEFIDYLTNYCTDNKIIGGQISNAGQSGNGSSYHVRFAGHSSKNTLIGVNIGNDFMTDPFNGGAPRKGAIGVVDVEMAGNNTVQTCEFGSFASNAAAVSVSSRLLDCKGLDSYGVDSYSLAGPSPFTYTNTYSRRVAVYLSGGTMTGITKDGFPIFGATSAATVWLEPNESFVVSYSGAAPTVYSDRK